MAEANSALRAAVSGTSDMGADVVVALVMVLGAITVLTVFLTELQEDTSASLAAALADRDALKAEYYARSAVHLARLLIASEPKITAEIKPMLAIVTGGAAPKQIPIWAFVNEALGPFNDELSASAFAGMSGLDISSGKNLGLSGGGHFEVSIVDEDSKINVNVAAKSDPISEQRLAKQLLGQFNQPQYAPMFEGRDGDDQFSDAPTRCGAIIDWADSSATSEALATCDISGVAPTSVGNEDNIYQTLNFDYVRKNAAFDSLEELRLVRGVDDAFWTTFVEPDPDDPKKRNMTVWGKPQINVSTADPMTLLGIICANVDFNATDLCTNPEQAAVFVSSLALVTSMLGFMPITSVKQLTAALKGTGPFGVILQQMGFKPVVGLNEGTLKEQIKFDSKVFSIYAEGVVPGYKKELRLRLHAVVDFSAAQKLGANVPGALGQPPASGSTADAAAAAAQAALTTDPLGTVIYWRIE